MFYKLAFDMENLDESIINGTNTIYAQQSNLDDIECEGIKKGYFVYVIQSKKMLPIWPNVEFYYSSKASNLESDYLLNVDRWPIIHVNVMNKLKEEGIQGIEFLPVKLVDVVTNNINNNYVVMYVTNFIDGYDMEKSIYKYNEKYDLYTFIPGKTFLKQDTCLNYDIFRCEKHPSVIYVSQKFKDIVENNKWTGFLFYDQP